LFLSCHQQVQAQLSKLSGELILELTLGADGKVTRVNVLGGSLKQSPLVSCLTAKLSQLALPPSGSGKSTMVKFKLVFLY